MAKISPVSIKYMIHANFSAEGALEKPDVIGAIFGQTEGLLGADLEMRELQKEGKIGRIEIERIEDVRGSKRDYIIERAKKLMAGIEGSTDSREISNTIKDSARMSEVQ